MKTICPKIKFQIVKQYSLNDQMYATARIRQFLRAASVIVTRTEAQAARLAASSPQTKNSSGEYDVFIYNHEPADWFVTPEVIGSLKILWANKRSATVISDRELIMPLGMVGNFKSGVPINNIARRLLLHEMYHIQQFLSLPKKKRWFWGVGYLLNYLFGGKSIEMVADVFADKWVDDKQIIAA